MYDLIVIGSGPAGYIAAIKASQKGLKTLVIEKKKLGGMCLNWGCVPTNINIESARRYHEVKNSMEMGITGFDPEKIELDWSKVVQRQYDVVGKLKNGIDYLFKKYKVDFLNAEAKIISETKVQAGDKLFDTKYILIATGSRHPDIQDFSSVIEVEHHTVETIVPENPLIYGLGSPLVEIAQFFAMIDKKPIILATSLPLVPELDHELDNYLIQKFRRLGVPIIPENKAEILADKVIYEGKEYPYDEVINVNKRVPNIPPMDIKLEMENGFIKVDRVNRTSVPNIFAAGDVNGKGYFAHMASAQGLEAVEAMLGVPLPVKETDYPINLYTYPEIAQIGMTEQEAIATGHDYKTRKYPLTSNAKALAQGLAEGFVRIIYDPVYDDILGAQIVASNATDIISEIGVLINMNGNMKDLSRAIHAHPTISEVFVDAADI